MAAIDPAVGNPLLDVLLPNGASGTLTLGALTLTLPFTCKFLTTRGTAGAAGTAITGTASTSLAGLLTSAAASISNVPTKANTGTVSITTTAGGTWNGNEIFDSTGTPKRVLYGPAADLLKVFNSGDILAINTGNLQGTVV